MKQTTSLDASRAVPRLTRLRFLLVAGRAAGASPVPGLRSPGFPMPRVRIRPTTAMRGVTRMAVSSPTSVC